MVTTITLESGRQIDGYNNCTKIGSVTTGNFVSNSATGGNSITELHGVSYLLINV
jgi:hypothetical protein